MLTQTLLINRSIYKVERCTARAMFDTQFVITGPSGASWDLVQAPGYPQGILCAFSKQSRHKFSIRTIQGFRFFRDKLGELQPLVSAWD